MVQRQVTVLSLIIALQAVIYGYLTLTLPNPPYGEMTRPLGYLSFAVAFIVIYGQFRYLRKLHF